MRIIIYGANDIGSMIATEFFEDHDITIIDKEENKTDDKKKTKDGNYIVIWKKSRIK